MKIIGHVKRFWKFHSLIIGAFGICALTLGCAIKEPAVYEGTWVVTDAYPQGASSVSDSADRVLGSSVTYSAKSARLDQATCNVPVYKSERLNSDNFLFRYSVEQQQIGFTSDDVIEITLSCSSDTSDLGRTLLLQQDAYAVTPSKGMFFRLEKAKI